LETTSVIAAVELNNPQYWRSPYPSHTFHGRDIFAPVGAHLTTGVPLAELGDAIAPESLIRLPLPELQIKDTEIVGCIQYIDYFGNSISNIRGDRLKGESWLVTVADKTIRLATTYSDVASGELLALVGSHGWLEVAVNGGNAATQLSLGIGKELTVKKLVI
jgi:hypothetical protein